MREDGKAGDILIYGNAGYFPERDLRYSFEDRRIAVVCPQGVDASSSGKIRWYKNIKKDSSHLDRLFRTYEFDTVIFISGYLTYGNEPEGETNELRRLFKLCRKYDVDQAVCLVPGELLHDESQTDRWMDTRILEWLCKLNADDQLHIAFAGCPYLADPQYGADYFNAMFAALEDGKDWSFPEPAGKKTDFITSEDMCAFLSRYLDTPQRTQFNELEIRNYTEYTFGLVAAKLKQLYPGRDIRCTGDTGENENMPAPVQNGEDYAREKLGWFARYDVFRDIDGMRAGYLMYAKKKGRKNIRLRERLVSGNILVELAEILVSAAVMETLNRVLQNSAQFRMIDVRLLYVVLISSVYGMKAGMLSAALASVSLFGAYWSLGINAVMLFFDPANWLPFMLLFAVAGFCGLERERHDGTETGLTERNEELTRENEYTDQLYAQALDSKQEYRQNLIQSKGGFGRIYSAVQKLAVTDPSKIYGESIGVIEDTLENHSIAIYSVSERQSYFARLEVSSKELKDHREKSVRLSELADVVQTLEKGELWVNSKLIPGRPMYAYGIRSEGKLRILIVLWRAGFGQMSSYYENLIRVIGGLTQTFMLTAWSFQEATAGRKRISGTDFLTDEAFQEELSTRREMADDGLATYTLFRIAAEDRTPQEMSEVLRGKLRDTDMVTKSTKDGDYYVLALQSDASSEKIILNRFRSLGLTCETVEIRGGL